MNASLLLVVCVLAVYRGARLITIDTISERPRDWLIRKTGRVSRKLSDLVGCPFCVSVHLAGWLTLGLVLYDVSVPLPLVWWFATAGGAALAVAVDLRLSSHD